MLYQAFDMWVESLVTRCKTSKERKVALALRRKWLMSDEEWVAVEEIIKILEVRSLIS